MPGEKKKDNHANKKSNNDLFGSKDFNLEDIINMEVEEVSDAELNAAVNVPKQGLGLQEEQLKLKKAEEEEQLKLKKAEEEEEQLKLKKEEEEQRKLKKEVEEEEQRKLKKEVEKEGEKEEQNIFKNFFEQTKKKAKKTTDPEKKSLLDNKNGKKNKKSKKKKSEKNIDPFSSTKNSKLLDNKSIIGDKNSKQEIKRSASVHSNEKESNVNQVTRHTQEELAMEYIEDYIKKIKNKYPEKNDKMIFLKSLDSCIDHSVEDDIDTNFNQLLNHTERAMKANIIKDLDSKSFVGTEDEYTEKLTSDFSADKYLQQELGNYTTFMQEIHYKNMDAHITGGIKNIVNNTLQKTLSEENLELIIDLALDKATEFLKNQQKNMDISNILPNIESLQKIEVEIMLNSLENAYSTFMNQSNNELIDKNVNIIEINNLSFSDKAIKKYLDNNYSKYIKELIDKTDKALKSFNLTSNGGNEKEVFNEFLNAQFVFSNNTSLDKIKPDLEKIEKKLLKEVEKKQKEEISQKIQNNTFEFQFNKLDVSDLKEEDQEVANELLAKDKDEIQMKAEIVAAEDTQLITLKADDFRTSLQNKVDTSNANSAKIKIVIDSKFANDWFTNSQLMLDTQRFGDLGIKYSSLPDIQYQIDNSSAPDAKKQVNVLATITDAFNTEMDKNLSKQDILNLCNGSEVDKITITDFRNTINNLRKSNKLLEKEDKQTPEEHKQTNKQLYQIFRNSFINQAKLDWDNIESNMYIQADEFKLPRWVDQIAPKTINKAAAEKISI